MSVLPTSIQGMSSHLPPIVERRRAHSTPNCPDIVVSVSTVLAMSGGPPHSGSRAVSNECVMLRLILRVRTSVGTEPPVADLHRSDTGPSDSGGTFQALRVPAYRILWWGTLFSFL